MESELIKNRERAKQLLAFDDMQYGRCRPTDIDLSMDFQGRTFVFGELKGNNMPLTLGQKIHLEGLVKGLRKGGKTAYAFLAHHDTPDCEHDVHVGDAVPAKVFNGNTWFTPEQSSVDSLLKAIHEEHVNENQS